MKYRHSSADSSLTEIMSGMCVPYCQRIPFSEFNFERDSFGILPKFLGIEVCADSVDPDQRLHCLSSLLNLLITLPCGKTLR